MCITTVDLSNAEVALIVDSLREHATHSFGAPRERVESESLAHALESAQHSAERN